MMGEASKAYLRESIRHWLRFLNRELGHYEQTTHSHIFAGRSLEDVLAELVKVYNDPTAFNISNLSQSIEAWTEVER